MNNNEALKTKVFSYGILGIPLAFLGFPLFIYLPNFYVEYLGFTLSSVGIILFFSRIIDMFLDPIIGNFTDNYLTKKTIILFSYIFLIIGIYFLINPFSKSLYWLFIFSTLTYISYSFILIPYLTLNSEIVKKEHFTKLSFSREFFIILGVIIALLLPYIFNVSQNSEDTLNLLLNLLLIIIPISLFIFIKGIDEPKKQKKKEQKFIKYLLVFFNKHPNNKKILYAFLLNNLANALPATLFLFYVKYVLNLEEKSGEFLLIYFFSSIFTFLFWIKLSKKFGLENTWIISISFSIIAFSFVPFLNEGDYLYFLMICIFTGMCLGSDMAIPTSIQSSIAQKHKRIKGILFGFWAMITKLALSLAVLIAFLGLDYNLENISTDSNTNIKLIILYSIIPIILKIFAIVNIHKYKKTNYSY
ncbi:MFS transporter [Malaciobacter pacificus]|uniref:Major facilitator superfamily transporter n=1 Tax=Malaciobacter pacificus TaxID=1080223 RepID=A0A5C2H7W9_9BACT|nr:MFS transporter [Malaciobacter pacificus]QEP34318.1 major facilitator superfamily transporter [Malaciobacter pacificus]GGD48025.1 MFS transporter [Malaciobacter pacificus]